MTALVHADMPTAAAGPADARTRRVYAGFWRRAMAAGIDGLMMLALVVGISIAAGVSVSQVNDTTMIDRQGRSIPLSEFAKPRVAVTRAGAYTTTVETTTATVGFQTIHSVVTRTDVERNGGAQVRVSTSSNLSMYPSALAIAAFFALWLIFASVLESSWLRATPGKLALFIRVSDEDGRRATLPRALARNVLKLVSGVPLCIGYLMAGWTAKKQALHDMLAGCTVGVALD